ncbi:alpha/beta hydrolase [Sorangium sp. So ce341]|uniref:alpha/beta hydrolase n=1 Tax=Sorangium sp. So ce341 TaxID=3133302 RepID=UPI003F5FA476
MSKATLEAKNSTNVRSFGLRLRAVRAGLRAVGALSPEAAAQWAERIYRTPRRHARPAWEREALAAAAPSRVASGAGEIPVWTFRPPRPRSGDPAVLLVHGWEGRGSQLSAFVPRLLAAGLRVVAFDAPGHGDHPKPDATVVDLADALARVARAAGPIEGIVAHSLGGVAAVLAQRGGVRANRYAFVAPPLNPHRFIGAFVSFFGLDPRAERRLKERIEARTGIALRELDGRLLAPRMRGELLVVHDRQDQEVLFEEGLALAGAWPGARLHETQGLGHRRVLRDSDVIREVASFIAGAEAAADTGLSVDSLEGELFHRELRWVA